ncbi:MAG: hypothetical protein WDO24_22820 [Pseudomonadota bacterium]
MGGALLEEFVYSETGQRWPRPWPTI